tara:strand:+ start:405 stop:617 length:213 start_codon:yes stop_codon:yes gene_type:complete
MKSFLQYISEDWLYAIPSYPVQVDTDKDDGEWITGDPPMPIEIGKNAKADIARANKQVDRDRKTTQKNPG